LLTINGQPTTLQAGDIAKVQILGFGLSKIFFLRAGKLITDKRQVDRDHHVMPALDDAAAYVGLYLVALCADLWLKKREDIHERGFYHFEFIAPEKKDDHPEDCPNCGGKLERVVSGTKDVLKGDLRCTGECKKFFFIAGSVLLPSRTD
jgi:hypothetical protein